VSLMCVDNIMPCFLSHVELCVHNSVPAFFVSQFVCKDRPRSPKAKQLVELLYETALMSSGFTPDNPPEFGSKVYEMMALALAAWRAASENLHSNHQISSSASQGRKKRQNPAHLLQI
jgi:hypothetical protein